jgi:hypothetical protein
MLFLPYSDRRFNMLYIGFLDEDLFGLIAKSLNFGFLDIFTAL